VRQALGNETVEVVGWDVEQIHASRTIAAVYRFAGEARDADETVPWSLVLKVIGRLPNRDDPASRDYWKREPLAYQSGLLDELSGGLAAPRCFGVVERLGDEFRLWLEEVKDEIGPEWPLEHYGIVARHLGRFNGSYLVGRAVPSHPWLRGGRLRWQLGRAEFASGIAQLRDSLRHPLVQRVYPRRVAGGVFRLWDERERFLEALEGLPQTFCHFDAFRRNLFARRGAGGGYQTVAIDWTYAGTGAVGEEIAPLVAASLSFREVDWDQAPKLDTVVFEGFLEGLRDADWDGDPRLVRLVYAMASVLRYGVGHTDGVVSMLMDESQLAQWAQVMGCSMQEMVDHLGQWLRFLLTLGVEARELLDEL